MIDQISKPLKMLQEILDGATKAGLFRTANDVVLAQDAFDRINFHCNEQETRIENLQQRLEEWQITEQQASKIQTVLEPPI
jgi:hypothetical protein